jgi:hypothetical protein
MVSSWVAGADFSAAVGAKLHSTIIGMARNGTVMRTPKQLTGDLLPSLQELCHDHRSSNTAFL